MCLCITAGVCCSGHLNWWTALCKEASSNRRLKLEKQQIGFGCFGFLLALSKMFYNTGQILKGLAHQVKPALCWFICLLFSEEDLNHATQIKKSDTIPVSARNHGGRSAVYSNLRTVSPTISSTPRHFNNCPNKPLEKVSILDYPKHVFLLQTLTYMQRRCIAINTVRPCHCKFR